MYVSATSSRFSRGRSTPTKRANVTPSWFRRSVRATFPVGPRPPTEGGVLANRWCAWDGPGAGRPVLALALHRFRSEEHTSELQSRFDLVCRLLLEQKKRVKQDQRKLHTPRGVGAHLS